MKHFRLIRKKTIVAFSIFFLALVGIEASAQDVIPESQIESIDSCFTDCINTGGADLLKCLRQCLVSSDMQQGEPDSTLESMCVRPVNANRLLWNYIECRIDEIVREKFEGMVNEKFTNVILMTDQKCEMLGNGWRPYQKMEGRFPLAFGQGSDDRGETITFELGKTGGEYKHQLSVQEMPAHTHGYLDRYNRGIRADYGDDEPTERDDSSRTTKSTGGNEPHNNMPPYVVLSFCYYKP